MYFSVKAPHIVCQNSNGCSVGPLLLTEISRISGRVEKLPASRKLARQYYTYIQTSNYISKY